MSTWQENANMPQSEGNSNPKSGERSERFEDIDHTSALSNEFGQLFNQSEYSDVELVIESKHFHAHRVILAARSTYFRALFYGGLRESQQTNQIIELKECKAEAFEILLLYIYTGKIRLNREKEEVLLDLLGLVHQYGFDQLENSLSIYLKSILSLNNVCIIYDTACLFDLNHLRQYCAQFIDNHADDIIHTNEFLTLSPEGFASIISRDSFYCLEMEIFNAVKTWHEYYYRNKNEECQPFKEIISKVRLALISMYDLLKIVRYSKLFDLNAIMDAIEMVHTGENGNLKNKKIYRGRLRINENIISKGYPTTVIEGDKEDALRHGNVISYDLEHGYTRHLIDGTQRICVKLDGLSIINHIKLLLWDKDTRTYSYYIEVSVDQINWIRVVDHRTYPCRSWQRLYFPPTVASFIRVVGTHNSVNKFFHLVSLEAYYKENIFALIGDIQVPLENVATIETSATVSEGVSRVRNALINGDYQSYDWDTGYTCHQIGSGGIVIQLSQPYIVSSMRLLLWDCDNRAYSYYIETSCDNVAWTMVVDKRTVACRSWQVMTFAPRIVTFIRICGTQNTANEVFHCVHFECPCQPDALKSYSTVNKSDSHTEEDGVNYEEFSKYLTDLSDSKAKNTIITDEKSLKQTHTILPYMIKPNSAVIFPVEDEF